MEDKKGIILYSSRYGAAVRYAGWLAAETGFDCEETAKADIADVEQYDTVILGGGVYASGIAGLSFLKKNIGRLRDKKVIVYCVGASPSDETAVRQIIEHNLKDGLAGVPCFYCRGALDLNKMSFVDRNVCKLLLKAVEKKDPADREPLENALMEAGDGRQDWTDRAYLEPVLAAVRGETAAPAEAAS